jgi:hypothetical protein
MTCLDAFAEYGMKQCPSLNIQNEILCLIEICRINFAEKENTPDLVIDCRENVMITAATRKKLHVYRYVSTNTEKTYS